MALVLLKVFIDTGEARIVEGMLAAHGIPTFLFDEHMGGGLYPSTSMFGVRLMVHDSDAEAAAELLRSEPGLRP